VALKSRWQPESQSTVKIIAELRNGDPLALEHQFQGGGRVITFLTTVSPVWNNWALANPSFPVTILELQNYLAGSRWHDNSREVGGRAVVDIDPAEFKAVQHELYEPGASAPIRLQAGKKEAAAAKESDEAKAGAEGEGEPKTDEGATGEAKTDEEKAADAAAAEAAKSLLAVTLENTRKPGVYRLLLQRVNGNPDERWFLYNVNPAEGDLTLPKLDNLKSAVHAKVKWQEPEATGNVVDNTQRSLLSEWLLYVLIILLIGEQVLAYSASYHTASPTVPGADAHGGAAPTSAARPVARPAVKAVPAGPVKFGGASYAALIICTIVFGLAGAFLSFLVDGRGSRFMIPGIAVGAGIGAVLAKKFAVPDDSKQ
jgi:hypothetical protein